MIETEQKLIQIGSSEGITLSKKNLEKLGAKRGDMEKAHRLETEVTIGEPWGRAFSICLLW